MYPKVICHIMSSVDGRLLTDRWTPPFDGKSKNELLGIYAAIGRKLDTDAWMFGKRTLTEGFFPRKFRPAVLKTSPRPEIFVASRSSERLFIVADPETDILYDSSTVRGDTSLSSCRRRLQPLTWSGSVSRTSPTSSPDGTETTCRRRCRRSTKYSA